MHNRKKARPPKWWGRFVSHLPKFSIPGLAPRVWTRPLAERWIAAIPAKCPFERQLWWGERLVLYVPPLCPLNPLSVQLYGIRIAAQEYLSANPDTGENGPPGAAV